MLDALICRSKPTYSLQLTKNVFPSETDYTVCSHKVDGSYEMSKFEKNLKRFNNCIQLRMFQRQGQVLKVVFEVDLEGMLDGLIKFTSDDKLVTIFDKKRSRFSLYQFDKPIQEFKDDVSK